ncbi:hypothetical protein OC844_007004 [Tilletia horrida]|nr:hypothetical protein OC844_007004 [Tilletia horrida]
MPPKRKNSSTNKGPAASGSGSGSGSGSSSTTSAVAGPSSSTSTAAATTAAAAAKQPPKKKARTSSSTAAGGSASGSKAGPGRPPKAKGKSAAKPSAASSSSTTAAAAAGAAAGTGANGTASKGTNSRIATLASKAPEFCSSFNDACEVARLYEAHLAEHDAQGCPEMMHKHTRGARAHTSFRKRLCNAKVGSDDEQDLAALDAFSDDDTDDGSGDAEKGKDRDVQGGAAALLLLGQPSAPPSHRDEYGRTAVKVNDRMDLLHARRAWLKERKRLLEKALAFWQRAETLEATGKQFEPSVKAAKHTLDLVLNYNLPQEGLPMLLKALLSLQTALGKAKYTLSPQAQRDWDALTKVIRAYHAHYNTVPFVYSATPAHHDLLRTLADVGYQLALMRSHFREHITEKSDQISRPAPLYSMYTSRDDAEVSDKMLLLASSAFKTYLVDQMSSILGADISYRSRVAQRKDGPQQKALPAISATSSSQSSSSSNGSGTSAKFQVTPAMLMQGISALYDPMLSDFKAPGRDVNTDITSRSVSYLTHHRFPTMSTADWQLFATAQRKIRYTRVVDRAQSLAELLTSEWSVVESSEFRPPRGNDDDWISTVALLQQAHRRVRPHSTALKSLEERVLAEVRSLLAEGLDQLPPAVVAEIEAAARQKAERYGSASELAAAGLNVEAAIAAAPAPAATAVDPALQLPPQLVPNLTRLGSDVRSQIFDLDGRVAALIDLVRVVMRLLRFRFRELSRIGTPGMESSTSSTAGANATRSTTMSSTLGAGTRKGFFVPDSVILESATRLWKVAHAALDLLHAALDRLTGPEWIDLDEVSDLEAVLIQAERGTREWSDRRALTTEVSRVRLRLMNWVAEIRSIMANEVLAPWLAQVEWDTDKLEPWRPRDAIVPAQEAADWAKWKKTTTIMIEQDQESGSVLLGGSSPQAEDARQALAYLRHMYLVQLSHTTAHQALRLAGLHWAAELRTSAPFRRAKSGAQREAARSVRLDVRSAHCRDDWQVSARRAEALVGALRAGFHSWRASIENGARLKTVTSAAAEEEEGGGGGGGGSSAALPALAAFSFPIAGGGASSSSPSSAAAPTSELSTSTTTTTTTTAAFLPSLALPAHSFLPKTGGARLRSAFRTVQIVYAAESERRARLAGLALAFRALIDPVALEKLPEVERAGAAAASGSSGGARGGSGFGAGRSGGGAGGSGSGSGSGSGAGAGGSRGALSSSRPAGASRDKDEGRDYSLTRLPRAGKAWKMHFIAFNGCSEDEKRYLSGGTNVAEPYMNEMRKTVLSVRASSSTASGSAYAISTEAAFGLASTSISPSSLQSRQNKKGLPVRASGAGDEALYGELAVTYRERCFWVELVRATLGDEST